MASSSYVIQQLIPALATGLARLRRTPGRNEAWVEDVLKALEKADAACHQRMRRRIGFAGRLGDLARLTDEDKAKMTLGLFFHELFDRQPARSRATGSAWIEYLMRNEDWLAPAFEMCEAVISDEWDVSDTMATIVAKATVIFDNETLERHERPLQVLQELGEIESPIAEIIPLLWSEEGQELCDHHFKRHPRGYKLEASDLQGCFATLRKHAPRSITAATNVVPFRLSGATLRTVAQEPDDEAPVRMTAAAAAARQRAVAVKESVPVPAGANFDRRRQALRARAPIEGAETGRPRPPQPDEQRERANERSPIERVLEERTKLEEPVAELTDAETPVDDIAAPEEFPLPDRYEDEPDPSHAGPAQQEERPMEQTRTISPMPPGRRDALEMMQKLRDVRLQLGQIQRIALDAEQLLTGLAPQLDELASWITDLDAVVDRWRGGHDGIERAA